MEVEVEILRIAFGGGGIGYYHGYTIMVSNVCVGDRVLARIKTKKKKFANADLVKVITYSASEASRTSADQVLRADNPPLCPYFDKCGGCTYMHLSLDSQRILKRTQVIDSLERIGRFRLDKGPSSLMRKSSNEAQTIHDLVTETVSSPKNYAFRNRIRLHTRSTLNRLTDTKTETVGLLARGDPSTLVPIPHCVIADPSLNLKLAHYLNEKATEESSQDHIYDADADIPMMSASRRVLQADSNPDINQAFSNALDTYQDKIWDQDIYIGDMTQVSPSEYGVEMTEQETDDFYHSLQEPTPSIDHVSLHLEDFVRGAKSDGTARRSASFRMRVMQRMKDAGKTIENLIEEENERTGSTFSIGQADDINTAESSSGMLESDETDLFSPKKVVPLAKQAGFKKIVFGSPEMQAAIDMNAFADDIVGNTDDLLAAFASANPDLTPDMESNEDTPALSNGEPLSYQATEDGQWYQVRSKPRQGLAKDLDNSSDFINFENDSDSPFSSSRHPSERYHYVNRYDKSHNWNSRRNQSDESPQVIDPTETIGGSGVIIPTLPSTYRALLMRSRFADDERAALSEMPEVTTAGQTLLNLEKYGWYLVPPGCFFQTNLSVLPRFVSIIREKLASASNEAASRNHGRRPPRHVIDAHCGVGFLSLALSVPQPVFRTSISTSPDAFTPEEIIEMGYDYPNNNFPYAPVEGELIGTEEEEIGAFTVDSFLGIEVNPKAVTAADVNASRFKVDQKGLFLASPVEEALPRIRQFMRGGLSPQKDNPLHWNPEFTTVLLDPPRTGLDTSTISTLLSMRCDQIIYVSCDPTTMARDLALLCSEANLHDEKTRKTSYELVSVTPVDMFPQTSSVEVVVDLRRI